jgi:hypothetical chaperone protein
MKHLYSNPQHHQRLMRVVERRLGHALMGQAEHAKIAVAGGGRTEIDLEQVEEALRIGFDERQLIEAGADEAQRIADAARHTVALAGVGVEQVAAIYFTGGTTGLKFLTDAIAAQFPAAESVFGDALASVAKGLGIHAQRVFA